MWKDSKISKLIFMSSLVKHDMHLLHLLYHANNIAISVTWQSLGGILSTERQKSCRSKPGETSTHPTHELHPPKDTVFNQRRWQLAPTWAKSWKVLSCQAQLYKCVAMLQQGPKIIQHCSMSACITERNYWPVVFIFSHAKLSTPSNPKKAGEW